MITFKYRKEDGSVTERVFIPLQEPGDKYFGIDISELDMEDQGLFASDIEALQDEFNAKVNALMIKYDMKYKYRTFLASGVFDLVKE